MFIFFYIAHLKTLLFVKNIYYEYLAKCPKVNLDDLEILTIMDYQLSEPN